MGSTKAQASEAGNARTGERAQALLQRLAANASLRPQGHAKASKIDALLCKHAVRQDMLPATLSRGASALLSRASLVPRETR